ncbi:MAG: hypothetical protein K2X59_05405 [Sphingomonas sp.]|nr:hypothetical protein [Sphingomonas sp.]
MSYRPEFEAALRLLAQASEAMVARGLPRPILVGGGAVELYSGSAISTGDFDLSTARQAEFEEILRNLGFVKPSGPGKATRGWIHPQLALGFEIVSATLLDGLADRDRVLLVDVGPEGEAAILSVEDIIADRMGQFASGSAPEMREQAQRLLSLHSDADRAYLDRRIREETGGDYGWQDV